MSDDQTTISVLVLDDEKSYRDIITEDLLSVEHVFGLKWDIDYAESQEGAIRKIKNNHYKIIFLDLEIPYLDGGQSLDREYGKRVAIYVKDNHPDIKTLMLSSHAKGHLSMLYQKDKLISWSVDKTELTPEVFKDAVNFILSECAEQYSLTSDGRKRITSGTFRLYPEKLTLLVKGHNEEISIGNRINHPSKSKNVPYLFISALDNGENKALTKSTMVRRLAEIQMIDSDKIKDRVPSDSRLAFHKRVTEKVEQATSDYTVHCNDLLVPEQRFGLKENFKIENVSE